MRIEGWKPAFWVLLCMGFCVGVMGCKSTPKGVAGSDSLASVIITNRTMLEVAKATSEVFQEAGFMTVPLPQNNDNVLVFEKEGSAGDLVLYGDWSGKRLWYRAKVRFSPMGPDTRLVTCDLYRVRNHGEEHFEEAQRLEHSKRGTYQDLLNKVKARLAR